jgi:hypothetical protein
VGFSELVDVTDRAVQDLLGGGPVRYTPEFGAPVDVPALFVASYVRADAGQAGVSTTSPAVFARLSDLPTDPGEDDPVITANGVAWKVAEVKKDDQGGVMLFLSRA